MALQVWLPLSGNTSNYGLSDLETQRTGQIMYGSGLFGDKCFQSGDGAVIIHGSSLPAVFTLSMWIKPNSPAINATLLAFSNGDHIDMSTDTITYKWNGGSVVADNSTAFEANDAEWSHLAFVVNGTNVKVFVNGVLQNTITQNSAFAATDIYIGQRADGSNGWDGYIQDVKLFDYVISTRELQNMTLGLVLNYTFNHNGFGNPNIMVGSTAILHVEGVDKINRVENNRMYADLEAGTYTLSADTTGTWTATNSNTAGGNVVNADPSEYPTALELYTLDGNDEVADRFFVDMTGGFGNVNITTAGRYYLGGIVYSDGVTSVEADFSAIKLEVGTKPSAWIPPVGTPEYSFFDIGEVEYDTSGNGLDGTPSELGPIWTNDSRIYSGAYDFSNNAYIESPVIDVNNLTKFTVSVWAKAASFGNCILFGFNTNPRFNLAVKNGAFGIIDFETGNLIPFGEGGDATEYTGVWHQFTVTGDGSVNKLYIDGELIGATATYVALGSSKLYINGWDNSSNNNFNGLLSDFRLYAIEFTAAQVATLYHNRAAIDNTGKLYTNEFVSADGFGISKTGVISGEDFTVFNTPITSDSKTTDNASRFSVSSTKVSAVDMIEM